MLVSTVTLPQRDKKVRRAPICRLQPINMCRSSQTTGKRVRLSPYHVGVRNLQPHWSTHTHASCKTTQLRRKKVCGLLLTGLLVMTPSPQTPTKQRGKKELSQLDFPPALHSFHSPPLGTSFGSDDGLGRLQFLSARLEPGFGSLCIIGGSFGWSQGIEYHHPFSPPCTW